MIWIDPIEFKRPPGAPKSLHEYVMRMIRSWLKYT